MTPGLSYLLGITLLLGATALVLRTFRAPLLTLLEELCGAEHRALFWHRLFEASLLLTVFFFSSWAPPHVQDGEPMGVLPFLGFFRAGAAGLLISLCLLALLMLSFIATHDRQQRRLPRGEVSAGER